MHFGKKGITAVILIAAALLVIAGLAVLVPQLTGSIALREKIVHELSRLLNADVKVKRCALAVLPRPRLMLIEVSVAFKNGLSATMETASACPALLPLLRGDLRPALISLEKPSLSVPLPQKMEPVPADEQKHSRVAKQRQAAAALAAVLESLPPCSLLIAKATVHLTSPGGALFRLEKMNAQVKWSSERLSVWVECGANIWEKLTLQASVRTPDLTVDGTAAVSRLALRPVTEYIFPGALEIGASSIDGALTFAADHAGSLNLGLKSSIAYLHRPATAPAIKAPRVDFELKADAHNTSVAFSTLLDYPRLSATGEYSFNNDARQMTLAAAGRDIDLSSCREVLLALAGDRPLIRTIGSRLKGGLIREISVRARGTAVADLVANEHFTLQGSLADVGISLPAAGLDVGEISGDVRVWDRRLEITNLRARIGNSRLHEATVQLELIAGLQPVLIDTMVAVDLAQIPALLNLLPDSGIRHELSRIQNPRGTLSGSLHVSFEKGLPQAAFLINQLLLQADYRAFPMPLELIGAAGGYANGKLSVKDLSVKLGSSMLRDTAARFDFSHNGSFAVTTPNAILDLNEVCAVLDSFPAARAVTRDISAMSGSVRLRSLNMSGPLLIPAQWAITAVGEVSNGSFSTAKMDGPVLLRNATFRADPDVFTLSNATLAFLDSSLVGSLSLTGYMQGIQKVTVSARGSLGQRSLENAQRYISISPDLLPRTPLAVDSTEITWWRGGATALKGGFSRAGGPQVLFDVQVKPDAFTINALKINDQDAESTLRLTMTKDLLDIAYTGTLLSSTLDRLLVNNRYVRGWIKGDFTAGLRVHDPLQSTAGGNLSWKNIHLHGFLAVPLEIRDAAVSADGNRLLIDEMTVAAGQNELRANGAVTFAESGYALDLSVVSDRLDLDAAINASSQRSAPAETDSSLFWDIPLRGTVGVNVGELKKGPVTVHPFIAGIRFFDRAVTISIADAKWCDIAAAGSAVVYPDRIVLAAHAGAHKAPLKTLLPCLAGEKAILTGSLDAQTTLTANGPPADLIKTLRGEVSIIASKGRIYKSGLLIRILSFLSIRNLIARKWADITGTGFSYRSISVQGTVDGSTFHMQEGILDSNTLIIAWDGSCNLSGNTVDITMLATPFQMPVPLVMNIPVVGVVFSRTLVGVPIRVTGTINDPTLGPGNPAGIAHGLFTVAQKLVRKPLKIIQPVLPGEKE